jgi:uncharacterized protein (TIGR02300 family)
MTKPELGTKRLCTECAARFYDLNAASIACPKCGARFRIVATATPTRLARRPAVRQPEVAPRKPEPTSPDPPDTLIEALDEDDEEISEIVGADSKDEGET